MAEALVDSKKKSISTADVSLRDQFNFQNDNLKELVDDIAKCDRMGFEDWEALKERVDIELKRKEILTQYKIQQLPNGGKWWTRIDGKLVQRVNRKDLEDYLLDLNAQTYATIRSIWSSYLESRRITVAATTWQKDILYYNNYISTSPICDKPLKKLVLSDGQDFFAHCKKENPGIKQKYWNNVQGILNRIMQYAINERLIENNPFANLRIGTNSFSPAKKSVDCDTVFSTEEQKLVCEIAENDSQAKKSALPLGIVLTFNLGIRLGEMCALKWKDIEAGNQVRYIHIQRELVAEINDTGKVTGYSILEHCKTPAGDRRLLLNLKAQELLSRIRQLNQDKGIPTGPDDYIFQRIRKGQILLCNHKVFDARIRTYCRNARMDVLKSFHDIRRTVLTNLYYAKMPLKDIQRFAGHSSIQQTMDYIKIKEDDLSALSFIETLMPIDEGISTEIISFEKKKATVTATGNPCFSR